MIGKEVGLCNSFAFNEITIWCFVNQSLLVSVGHLCILPERFAKKDLNHNFGHCFLRFIGKSSWILTNYTWLERGASQL